MKYDYVVIGAGAAGFTSSLILAKNGFNVALVEKAKKTGPLLSGFSRKGLYFDTGFHYTGSLGKGEILDLFFSYLGLTDNIQKEPFNSQCFDLFRFSNPKFEFQFPYGFEQIRESFHESFPKEKGAVDRYLDAIKDQCSSRPYLNLDIDVDQLSLLKSVHGQSVKEFLDGLTDDMLLKRLLSMHCFLHGVAADEVSFINHACIVGPYYESVHYIKGGGLSLVKAFDAELNRRGVDVFCGKGVTEILATSDGSIDGVRLKNDEILRCKGCICTIHPSNLLNLVRNSLFRPSYIKRLKSLEETLSAYLLYGECRDSSKNLTGTNIIFSSDSGYPDFQGNGPIKKRPLYINFTKQKNDKSTRHGFMAICPSSIAQVDRWSDSFTGKRPNDYYMHKERIAKDIQLHIEGTCCPELAGMIEPVGCSTPLTLRDYTNSPFGSLYGAKHRVEQYNPTPLTRVKGLFLAGQSTVAPGVLGAIISGFVACGNILGHDRLRKELKKCA